jgi:segregation and condensation protein B
MPDEHSQSGELHQFSEPVDDELTLNELSQAYAALLNRERAPSHDPSIAVSAEDAPEELISADAAFEVTPRGIVEAILFVGNPTGEPLTAEQIAGLMRGVKPAEIDELVGELNAQYEAARSPYAILQVGSAYKMALRPEFGPLRDAFHGRIREARLSQAAVDVLAIVGYHQPIAAEEIDRLRGKPSGAILGQLLRRDLLSVHRPEEKQAKPQYRTTGRFLGLFGLEDLSQLPRSQEIDQEL